MSVGVLQNLPVILTVINSQSYIKFHLIIAILRPFDLVFRLKTPHPPTLMVALSRKTMLLFVIAWEVHFHLSTLKKRRKSKWSKVHHLLASVTQVHIKRGSTTLLSLGYSVGCFIGTKKDMCRVQLKYLLVKH